MSEQNIHPAEKASRPAAAHAAKKPSASGQSAKKPAAKKPAAGKRKKKVNPVLMALATAAAVIVTGVTALGGLLKKANRKLDCLRRGEVQTVIVNSALGCVAVFAALCLLMACMPAINTARATASAGKGDVDGALRILASMQSDGVSGERMTDTRVAVIGKFIGAGKYDAAVSLAAELPAGEQATGLTRRANYAKADALYESGDYSAAAQLFYPLSDYEDGASRYADCRCALSIEAYRDGDAETAESLLIDVSDLSLRVQRVALDVGGSESAAAEILSAGLYQTANLDRLEATMVGIAEARSERITGRIAAGKFHTVALKADGTALAAGDNSFGQCNVSGWSGLTRIAAGTIHTVGLKSDGTVVATGDNSQGQCDVSGWTDIVSVACAAYDTIGLKSDGTVVAAGMHAAKVSGWHNASAVAGGSYSMACLTRDGSMLSSHGSAQMDLGVVLYDLSVSGPVSVGVLYDGSLVSTFDGAPEWSGLVTALATDTGVLAIDAFGAVQAHFYRPGDAVPINVPGKAVEIASSGTHHVVLTEDGSVHAFGENANGQCEVGGWGTL